MIAIAHFVAISFYIGAAALAASPFARPVGAPVRGVITLLAAGVATHLLALVLFAQSVGAVPLTGLGPALSFAGFMLGHEFVFRKIIFSQQLGFYLVKHTSTYTDIYLQPFPTIYHSWGLRYKLTPHWFIGFNMLVHNQVADFIDGRLTYRF